MPQPDQTPRPKNRETEHEMQKPGAPPRPSTEPAGSADSVRNNKTLTDPGTGEPTRPN